MKTTTHTNRKANQGLTFARWEKGTMDRLYINGLPGSVKVYVFAKRDGSFGVGFSGVDSERFAMEALPSSYRMSCLEESVIALLEAKGASFACGTYGEALAAAN